MADSNESPYRQYLPDLSTPRFTTMAIKDAHVYADDFKKGGQPPWIHALFLHWRELLKAPFKGVTTDGQYQFLQRRVTLILTLGSRQGPPRPLSTPGRGHSNRRNCQSCQNRLFQADTPSAFNPVVPCRLSRVAHMVEPGISPEPQRRATR